jgi:O-antigen/teichoic acid export membrane protein
VGYVTTVLCLGIPNPLALIRGARLKHSQGIAIAQVGIAGVVTAPMLWLVNSSDRWFLGHYRTAGELGVYSLVSSVALVGMMINSSLASVWLPEAARVHVEKPQDAGRELGRIATRFIAVLALVWLIVTAAGTELIMMLADRRFHSGVPLIPYLAGAVFFSGCLQIATTSLLLSNKLKWAAIWWVVGGIVSLIMNAALVPRYGGQGAAIVQCATFAAISGGMYALAQRYLHLDIDWGRLTTTIAVIVMIGALMSRPWHPSPYVSAVMKAPLGMLAATFVFWFIAPDWFAQVHHHLLARMRDPNRGTA